MFERAHCNQVTRLDAHPNEDKRRRPRARVSTPCAFDEDHFRRISSSKSVVSTGTGIDLTPAI